MDMAIQGSGYLVVKDGAGSGPETFRFTRDGRATLDRQARLALAEHEAQMASGYAQVAGGGAQERRDQASVLRMRVHGAGGVESMPGRRLRLVSEGGEA